MHERGNEVGIILVVVGWPVDSAVFACPCWLKVQASDGLDARGSTGLDYPVGFRPVEAAFAAAFDGAPLEERFLPAKAEVGHELEVTAGGIGMAPQKHAHPVVGAADDNGRGGRGCRDSRGLCGGAQRGGRWRRRR